MGAVEIGTTGFGRDSRSFGRGEPSVCHCVVTVVTVLEPNVRARTVSVEGCGTAATRDRRSWLRSRHHFVHGDFKSFRPVVSCSLQSVLTAIEIQAAPWLKAIGSRAGALAISLFAE